jgi:hypothetical protein
MDQEWKGGGGWKCLDERIWYGENVLIWGKLEMG